MHTLASQIHNIHPYNTVIGSQVAPLFLKVGSEVHNRCILMSTLTHFFSWFPRILFNEIEKVISGLSPANGPELTSSKAFPWHPFGTTSTTSWSPGNNNSLRLERYPPLWEGKRITIDSESTPGTEKLELLTLPILRKFRKFQVSPDNYMKALEFLEGRYGNAEQLINRLIDKLDRIVSHSAFFFHERSRVLSTYK